MGFFYWQISYTELCWRLHFQASYYLHICAGGCVRYLILVPEGFVLFFQELDYKKNIECLKVRLRDFCLIKWIILFHVELIVLLLVIIPSISWNQKFRCCIHKTLPFIPILSQPNLVSSLSSQIFCHVCLSLLCCPIQNISAPPMPRASWSDYPNVIWWVFWSSLLCNFSNHI